jgi:30S ribosomal protein S31
MGKGDKKTRRGKIVIGSFGVRRPRKKSKKLNVEKPLGPKPKKPVEEQVIMPVETPEIPEVKVTTPIPEEIPAVKKPVRKAAPKKTTEKAEKPEKAAKVEKEAAKPKTPKTRKKADDAVKDKKEETPKE